MNLNKSILILFKYNVIYYFISILLLSSCKFDNNIKNTNNDFDIDSVEFSNTDELTSHVAILYNMYLTVEINQLFNIAGAVYNSNLPNNPLNNEKYQISYEKAINIGVYAVDLCYTNAFQHYILTDKYLHSMIKLSNSLGIPNTFFQKIKTDSRNITSKDSLFKFANTVYKHTYDYLSDNDEKQSIALIIMGGWTEAMYLALNIANETASSEILYAIAQQNQSAQDVLSLLNQYKNYNQVAKFIPGFTSIADDIDNYTKNYAFRNSGIYYFNKLNKTIVDFRNNITLN